MIYNETCMSINDFFNKIKSKLNIDIYLILCLFIVILVGISSFGLGRLSVNSNLEKNSNTTILNRKNQPSFQANTQKREYLASKNGKLYYSIKCSKNNKIMTKNKIWFATQIEAETAGYRLSLSCN